MATFSLLMCAMLAVASLGQVTSGCGGNLIGDSGTFQSPNHPNNYPVKKDCTWTITVPTGKVSLEFTDFDVEDSRNCAYDYVGIFDGDNTSNLLGKFCGTSIPPKVEASGRVMTVQFVSDSSETRSGFSAKYENKTGPTSSGNPCDGGAKLAGDYGDLEIIYPDYPGDYPNNANCSWEIEVTNLKAGEQLQINFTMDVEDHRSCKYDSIQVYQGFSTSPVEKLCGSGSRSVKVQGNKALVVFSSDYSVAGTGFSATFSPYVPYSGQCGMKGSGSGNGGDRIVGGEDATKDEFPWQVSLQTTSSSFHFCGGTLLSDQYVLTAAHCVDGGTPSAVKVVLGALDLKQQDGEEIGVELEAIHVHKDYKNYGGYPNDIALLKLMQPVTLDANIAPACLPPAGKDYQGTQNCWLSGWGTTHSDERPKAGHLQKITGGIWNEVELRNTWGRYISDKVVGFGHKTATGEWGGACNGDSGGPLVCPNGSGTYDVIGVVSWGAGGCQVNGYPGVFTEVSAYRDWLSEKSNGAI